MIIWTGKTTNKAVIYKVEAETYQELLEDLIDEDIIDPYWFFHGDFFNALTDIFPLLEDIESLLLSLEEELAHDTFINEFDWEKKIFSKMSKEDWEYAISSCRGQAYYQEFKYSYEGV